MAKPFSGYTQLNLGFPHYLSRLSAPQPHFNFTTACEELSICLTIYVVQKEHIESWVARFLWSKSRPSCSRSAPFFPEQLFAMRSQSLFTAVVLFGAVANCRPFAFPSSEEVQTDAAGGLLAGLLSEDVSAAVDGANLDQASTVVRSIPGNSSCFSEADSDGPSQTDSTSSTS